MTKHVRCGRLLITRDGTIKEIDLEHGGGIRHCLLTHIDMGFEEIHDNLCDFYSIDPMDRNSRLYDFEKKELDTNRYQTFFEYFTRKGLKFNNTLLYLCTLTDNEFTATAPAKRKATKTTKTTKTTEPIQISPSVVKKIPQVEADSSTSPVIIKIADSPPLNHQSTDESVLSSRISGTLRISSFSTYSFDKSLNELIDYFRHLIIPYNRETVFIQLFEYICTMHGASSITLDRLKQQMQSIDEHSKQIYNAVIDKIEKLSRSIKALIELNKMKISQFDQESIITHSFSRFHRNFNILRDQWINKINSNQDSTSVSLPDDSIHPMPTTSYASSSSAHYHPETNSRRKAPSTTASYASSSSTHYHSETNSRRKTPPTTASYASSSSGHHHSETNSRRKASPATASYASSSSGHHHSETNSRRQAPPSTSYTSSSSAHSHSETNSRRQAPPSTSYTSSSSAHSHPETNSRRQAPPSTSYTSSSSAHSHSETNSRRPSRPSSTSHHHSETNSRKSARRLSPSPSYRTTSKEKNNEKPPLFDTLFKSLYDLSDVLYHLRYSSFDHVVRSVITEIEFCRSNINLSDQQSIEDVRQKITAIETRLTNRLDSERHRTLPHDIHRQLESSFDKTLTSIKHLLTSFHHYEDLINKNKRRRKSNWSTPPQHECIETKPVINSDQQHIKQDDDQSSEASHSSFGDEALMEVARDAYEQSSNRFK